MKGFDRNNADIKQFSSVEFCNKLSRKMWESERSEWLEYAEFIQTTLFLIDFDTKLNMEGIFSFLENSIGHYVPNIIKAFRDNGDDKDVDILSEL